MNKRTFLKTSSVLVTGSVLSPLMKFSNDEPRTNWAGNFKYTAKQYFQPKTLAEAQHLVAKTPILRGLGSRHSFNSIADSSEVQISLKELHQVVSLDKAQQQVTVEGGVTYGQVCQQLHQNGFALHNLASLPHISVAGACATATHGSGIKNGNLATSVAALEVIDAKGNLVVFSKEKNREEFNGAVVGLGGLGLISKVTLDLLPTFNMTQAVYQNMPMKALESNFDAVVASGYSVSLFTDWQNQRINQVWIKSKADGIQSASSAPELLGATLAHKHLHPLEDLSPENCTEQMGKIGPWYERMPHFKMGFTPSSGKELQSEYFLPIEHAYHAMMALEKLHEKVSPHLFISEIRTIATDDLWMSPCLGQPCVAFHFTWKQDWPAVKALLPLIEAQLAPFNARPHWGKLFTMPPQKLQSLIKKLPEFKELLATYDPKGKFRNSFLNHNLYTK